MPQLTPTSANAHDPSTNHYYPEMNHPRPPNRIINLRPYGKGGACTWLKSDDAKVVALFKSLKVTARLRNDFVSVSTGADKVSCSITNTGYDKLWKHPLVAVELSLD